MFKKIHTLEVVGRESETQLQMGEYVSKISWRFNKGERVRQLHSHICDVGCDIHRHF